MLLEIEVNQFVLIRLILEGKFADDPLGPSEFQIYTENHGSSCTIWTDICFLSTVLANQTKSFQLESLKTCRSRR